MVPIGLWMVAGCCCGISIQASGVLPGLVTNLVCHYDFEHAVGTNSAMEADLGFSGTDIHLLNGGDAMRTNDGAHPGSSFSLQTQQVNPHSTGNDDWKAGIYQTNGVPSLTRFSSVAAITIMGWIKPTGTNPNLNSNTAGTNDYYNAIGLFGLLSGNSEGHGVRALLEVLTVGGSLKLVALGRRLDGGNALTLAATNLWTDILPSNEWTHLAATFDFDNGAMALYRNGVEIGATNVPAAMDPWAIIGGSEPDLTSATSPAGIKIGGSYPQNSQEFNTFNGRFDDLMFFNRLLTAFEVQQQYAAFFAATSAPPVLVVSLDHNNLSLSWSTQSTGFNLESKTNLTDASWVSVPDEPVTDGPNHLVTLPADGSHRFFRLNKP